MNIGRFATAGGVLAADAFYLVRRRLRDAGRGVCA